MYLITNRHLCSEDRYLEVLKEASYNGVEYIVLREKDLDNRDLINLYFKVKSTINKNTKIIINSNLDVYNNVDADGIHLPLEKFMMLKNNKLIRKRGIVGVSTHSLDDIFKLVDSDIDYIFLSHIYETKCKDGLEPKGIDILKDAKSILKNTNIKLVALGGILPSNYIKTMNYCDDVAIMSFIMSSDNVKNAICEFV
ncbi:MAG: thiamine phosphate synthase [Romboutsia sp.]